MYAWWNYLFSWHLAQSTKQHRFFTTYDIELESEVEACSDWSVYRGLLHQDRGSTRVLVKCYRGNDAMEAGGTLFSQPVALMYIRLFVRIVRYSANCGEHQNSRYISEFDWRNIIFRHPHLLQICGTSSPSLNPFLLLRDRESMCHVCLHTYCAAAVGGSTIDYLQSLSSLSSTEKAERAISLVSKLLVITLLNFLYRFSNSSWVLTSMLSQHSSLIFTYSLDMKHYGMRHLMGYL